MGKKYKGIIKNRQSAAVQLLDVLPIQRYKDECWKVVALSGGGLKLASHINERYKNKIDILFSENIYAPNNSECVLACVSELEEIVMNENLIESFEIQYDYIYGEAHRKHEEKILSKIYRYRKGEPFFSVENESVLLIDDGSETGLRFMTALKTILSLKPKAVYIAVPVLPSDVLELLETFVDDIYYIHDIDDYAQTSLYYEEFEKIDEKDMEKLFEGIYNGLFCEIRVKK
jgi:putative phosphoribosyl transferase